MRARLGQDRRMTILNSKPESEVLRRITVRLVRPEERERFDLLLEKEHYLHSARLGGQALRYVAEWDGEWVALICFSAPAWHLKAREKWLKWSPRQRARRLCLVVNNSRFLVLPERHRYPNLASRVLASCLKRLDADWQERALYHPGLGRRLPLRVKGQPKRHLGAGANPPAAAFFFR